MCMRLHQRPSSQSTHSPPPHGAHRLSTDLGLVLSWVHLLHSSHCLFHQNLQCLVGLLPLHLPTAMGCHE